MLKQKRYIIETYIDKSVPFMCLFCENFIY